MLLGVWEFQNQGLKKQKIKLPTLLAFLVPFVAAQIILSYFDPPIVFAEKNSNIYTTSLQIV